MNDEDRTKEALFRYAILGDLLSRNLRRGELCPSLAHLSEKTFEDYRGRPRRMARKTLEEAGFTQFEHVRLSDMGMDKGKTPATPEHVDKVVARGRMRLTA